MTKIAIGRFTFDHMTNECFVSHVLC